ncbi:MAG: hypothetical protein Q8O32_03215 [bacterium]|nr:hypothetical protein [bacterium]
MPNKSYNYIFIDESGDPGKPYKLDSSFNKIPTGASMFYILSALCVDSQKLFAMEDMVLAVKKEFGYKKEIKSTEISLPLYKKLLNIINLLDINVYYRLVNKTTY